MDIKISKIKLRRGTNAQRKAIVVDQGELIATTDTKRLYLGTGTLSGGMSPTTIVHNPVTRFDLLSTIVAEPGDIVSANSRFYQLTGTNYADITHWGDVGQKVSSTFTLGTDNVLNLADEGINAIKINPSTVSNGLYIAGGVLQTNYDTKNFTISSTQLKVNSSGIDELEISSTAFGDGISGGSGTKIALNVDPANFSFVGGKLTSNFTTAITAVDSVTLSSVNGQAFVADRGINQNKIASTSFGNGISGGDGNLIDIKIDSTIFEFNVNGELDVASTAFGQGISGGSGNTIGLQVNPNMFYFVGDTLNLSVFDSLTGQATSNSSNSLSAIFNGTTQGEVPGLEITKFEGLSSNGTSTVTVILSSAGFLTFQGNIPTITGKTIGRFAIPIFTY